MKNMTADWETWLYVVLYLAFLGGLAYMVHFITLLPYILLSVSVFISWLIHRGKLKAIANKDASSFIAMFFMVIVVAACAILSRPYRYNSFIAKYFIPGKMVTRIVTVEADEGTNTWKEKRRFWRPKNPTGETFMDLVKFCLDFKFSFFVVKIIFQIENARKQDEWEKFV